MSKGENTKQVDLGVFARHGASIGLTPAEVIGLALSVVWLLGAALFFFFVGVAPEGAPADPMRSTIVVLAIFMPIALIWVATMAASSARVMREESRRLQSVVDAMRQAVVAQQQKSGMTVKPSVEEKLDQLVAAQRQTGAALATFTSIRAAQAEAGRTLVPEPAAIGPDGQISFAMGDAVDPQNQISVEDFIVALNFPETAEDVEGFKALRRAMQDRRAAELIQSSQDVLTLLSQDGIYMDDMNPDRARPEIWRRFAHGERGRTIAGLGGIRDRSGIALAASRMRQDHIFRDTVHHFLRKFDQVFAEFEEHASDSEIAALAETRTARGFMLLGRVAGTFD